MFSKRYLAIRPSHRLNLIGRLVMLLGLTITGCTLEEDEVNAPKIIAGAAHACAFDIDREQLVCWGDNSYGQLGNEEFSADGSNAPVRVKVISGRKIKSLAAGHSHTCALLSNSDSDTGNTVACWGYNHYGQVGDGANQDRNVPVFVNGPDGNPLKGVANITAGAYHTCASMARGSTYEGKTFCWGRNNLGQIGNGSVVNVNVPTEVAGLQYSGGVAAGTAHTCALTAETVEDAQNAKYQVVCWGDASRGQMRSAKIEGGAGYSIKPVNVGLELDGIRAIYSEHVVQSDVTTTVNKPVDFDLKTAVEQQTPAYGQTCAITQKEVLCWGGKNQNGQWGTTDEAVTEFKVNADEILSGAEIRAYGAGNAQSCMLVGTGEAEDTSSNNVACWGYSSSLGFDLPADTADGIVAGNRQTVKLQGTRPTGLAVGREFVCYAAKGEQPQIWCWGTGKKGQMGNGTTESTRAPVCVKGYCPDTKSSENLAEGQPFDEAPGAVPSALHVSAGDNSSCAVVFGGGVYCWGAKLDAANSKTYPRFMAGSVPEEVLDLGGMATSVSLGALGRCALLVGGVVKCWGEIKPSGCGVWTNDEDGGCAGQTNYAYASYRAPFSPAGLGANIKSVAMADSVVCGQTNASEVKCVFLDGVPTANTLTVATSVKDFALGGYGVPCVLKTDKTVGCTTWGLSYAAKVEHPVQGLVGEVQTFTGGPSWQWCAVMKDATVMCWTSPWADPTAYKVEGVSGVKTLAMGSGHTCALTTAGGVKCWGDNTIGQLGNGTSQGSATPVNVTGLQFGVLAINAGEHHTCALVFGGVVKCWGSNTYGQLGDGTTKSSNIPVQVGFGKNVGPRGEIVVKATGLSEGETQQKVTVTIPAVGGDIRYSFDCDGDGDFEVSGTVAGHECFYAKLGSGSYDIGYKITVKNLFGEVDVPGEVSFSVQNLPPVISAVTYDAGVIPAGTNAARNFTIAAVTATDPGNDALTYSYDCNFDGLIQGAAEENRGRTNAVCDLSGLAPATYSLRVFVTDADHATQGNGQTIKPITVTIVTPIDTLIDTHPAPYAGTTATFTFSSPQTTTIEVKLDGAAFAVTTSGMASYTALTDGTHTFMARAVTGGFADATPAEHTWIVDTVAPVTVSDTTFTEPVSVATVTVQFHASDANATAGFTYQCQLDGGAWIACAPGQIVGPVTEGIHSYTMAATDAAGNATTMPATVTWEYLIPAVILDAASGPVEGTVVATDAATFTWESGTDTEFECKLDAEAWVPCTSPQNLTGLGEGEHTFSVRPVRNEIPAATTTTRTWTVDTTPPETTIDDSYANDASGTSYSVEFSCGDLSCSYECRVDTDAFASCTSPFTALVSTEGEHTVEVQAYDDLNNVDLTPATANWTVTFPTGGGSSLSPATNATLATGSVHSCAIDAGALYCWGSDLSGQLGDTAGDGTIPGQMGTASDWKSVSAGDTHTCAIRGAGTLYCWGQNSYGQLGDPFTSTYSGSASPVTVAPSESWLVVAAASAHTCAIRDDQTLWCWGANDSGQLGLGTADYTGVTVPTQVGVSTDWVDVGGGYAFTCALNESGGVYCWGGNSMGQLGTGISEGYYSPLTAATLTAATLSVGAEYACAVYSGGTLYCWGDNNTSQGGNSVVDRTAPSQVGTAADWKTVEAGTTHTCALKTNGQRWCWGAQTNNALGDEASNGTQTTPIQTGTDADWLDISCGQGHCIGLRDTAGLDVFSWGDNLFSQCGTDGSGTPVVSPMLQLTPF